MGLLEGFLLLNIDSFHFKLSDILFFESFKIVSLFSIIKLMFINDFSLNHVFILSYWFVFFNDDKKMKWSQISFFLV